MTTLTTRPLNADVDPTPMFVAWQQDRDPRARELLVQRFMPLARKLALRYTGANEPVEDLLQVASLGLVNAIDRFDPARGLAFSSFAVPTILGELRRYFRDLGWAVHVPRGAQERSFKVESARRELTATSGRAPSIDELGDALGWNRDEVLAALEAGAAHHASSIDVPHDDEDGSFGSLADTFGQIDHGFEYVEDKTSVYAALEHLPRYERRVLYLRFVGDLTQSEIGDRLGISQMQVSRLLRDSLAKLRAHVDGETVEDAPAARQLPMPRLTRRIQRPAFAAAAR